MKRCICHRCDRRLTAVLAGESFDEAGQVTDGSTAAHPVVFQGQEWCCFPAEPFQA